MAGFVSAAGRSLGRAASPLVICGPSGVGKGTLIRLLMERQPSRFGLAVSHTTRLPRQGEQHGVHYHFVKDEVSSVFIDDDIHPRIDILLCSFLVLEFQVDVLC
jgi:ABC-type dipeptide/oligopeptide/nickel transport system ATPase subunit